MAVLVSWTMRALSARFSLTGGRSNYERTVGEKNSPQWLPRSGALREQRDGATRKAKTNNDNVQEDRKQRERPDVMNGNRKFCFSRIIVLYHSLDLLSWHNLVCVRPVNSRLVSFHFFFCFSGTGGVCEHRLTQPNLEAFVFTRHLVRRYRVRPLKGREIITVYSSRW